MKILITGANGQVGQAIQRCNNINALQLIACHRDELDITSAENIDDCLKKYSPEIIINCAGYTNVDRAESDIENAYAINFTGVANLARSCKQFNIPIIHISTDYVFSGTHNQPYCENDQTEPLNIYGKSKLAGEQQLQQIWDKHIIVRSSWIFSAVGENFVSKMLRLGQTRESLNIVADQIGGPTAANDLAKTLLAIAQKINNAHFADWGIFHYSGTPSVSWYEFADNIFSNARHLTTLQLKYFEKINSESYPTPAMRPKYSVLDMSRLQKIFALDASDWKNALRDVLPELLKK